jgi:divalent metal cation (Fe/Co/Zn/Cd) transporter
MKTLVQGITFTTGLLAFCGLLAWIESTPMTDSAVHQFADAFTGIINLIGL